MSVRSCVSWPTVTSCNRLLCEDLVEVDLHIVTACRIFSLSNGSSRPPRTTSSMQVSALPIIRSVHGNVGTEEAAMTGSLFSLPETQYINVEYIHLVEERERQLPKDRRSRIQQGFAASLFLPLFLFSGNFWLQITFRGEQTHFIGGPGACRPATGRQDPCRPMVGRQGPVAQWPGDRPL